MEITKQNESFTLKETTDSLEMNGNANVGVSGSIDINFNVNNLDGTYFGSCNYSKYSEESNVNFSLSCTEANRDELAAYADTVIDYVLNHFETLV